MVEVFARWGNNTLLLALGFLTISLYVLAR